MKLDDGKSVTTHPLAMRKKVWQIDLIISEIEIVCRWAFFGAVLISILIGLPSYCIWGSIFALQIISHLPLLAINFPLNEHKFLAFLNRVVSFDLMSPKPLHDIGFTKTSAYNLQFERLGYTTSNMLENLGAVPLLGFLFPVIILLKLSLALVTKVSKSAALAKVNEFFSWANIINFGIRFFLVTFFDFTIAIFLGLRHHSELENGGTTLDKISVGATYFCLTVVALLVCYVGLMTIIMGLDLSELKKKQEAEKDGAEDGVKKDEGQLQFESNRTRRRNEREKKTGVDLEEQMKVAEPKPKTDAVELAWFKYARTLFSGLR